MKVRIGSEERKRSCWEEVAGGHDFGKLTIDAREEKGGGKFDDKCKRAGRVCDS
jgi:hypothetical protein